MPPFLNRALVCAAIMAFAGSAHAQSPSPLPVDQVKAVFAQAKSISDKEGGRLWGMKLYGAMLFVDPNTRAAVANEPDPQGVLHAEDGVFIGTLPKDVIISNAPTEWEGKRWTLLIWPMYGDALSKSVALAHEPFHRIQPLLYLDATDSPNLQLDTVEGRVWLQLEWRALAEALLAKDAAQTTAIRDALAFRAHRHTLFPGSAKTEASLEIAEGVPEYTGVVAGAPDAMSGRWRTIAKLADPDPTYSFVRSFAYFSGPAYGLLLDARAPGWRKTLTKESDLSALLGAAVGGVRESSAVSRAALYGEAAIRLNENERAAKAESEKARYRALLVDGPTLLLPKAKGFRFSFNPSTLVSLGGASVYPTFHAEAAWGSLDVKDGALVPTDFSSVTVAAPKTTQGAHIEGPGWTLDLAPGWTIVEGAKAGCYVVKGE